MRSLLATIFCLAIVTGATAKEPDVKCVVGTGDRVEEKVAPPIGTVVGLVVGAVAADGDVFVTIMAGGIGCDVGKVFGKAWAHSHDTAAVIAQGMSYQIQKTTSVQGIIQFLGVSPPGAGKQTGPTVLSLDPGQNAIAIPITDAALKALGVSEQDRTKILIITTPVDPGNSKQKVDAARKVFNEATGLKW